MKLKLISIVISSIILIGCKDTQENNTQMANKPITEVNAVLIKEEKLELTSELNGRVVSSLVSEVRPQVTGIIQERLFEEGAEVKRGQVLYKIDPAQYQATYNQAKAAVNSAKADLESNKLKKQRYASLAKQKAISQQEADDASANYEKLLAVFEERKAALEIAKINLEYTKILAPISGVIGISSITPGALVTANQPESLAVIRSIDPVYVDVTRSTKELLKMRDLQSKLGKQESAPVQLYLENGKQYDEIGQLKLTEVSVDEATSSVTLRAVFNNSKRTLLPGMYVKTKIINAIENNGITVPQKSVSYDTYGKPFLYLIDKDNKVEKRNIEIYGALKDSWIVSSGVNAGDTVITEGTEKVRDGEVVNPAINDNRVGE